MPDPLYRLILRTPEDISELGGFLKEHSSKKMDYDGMREVNNELTENHYFITNGEGLVELLHFLEDEHAVAINFQKYYAVPPAEQKETAQIAAG